MKLPKELLNEIMRSVTRDNAVCVANYLTVPFCDGRRIIATDGRIAVTYDGDRDELPELPMIGKQAYIADELEKYLKAVADVRITDNLNTVDSMLRFEAFSNYALALAKRIYAGTKERYENYACVGIEGHYFRAEYLVEAMRILRVTGEWCGAPTIFFCSEGGYLRMKNERVSVVLMECLPHGTRELPFIAPDEFRGWAIVDGQTGDVENAEAVSDCIAISGD